MSREGGDEEEKGETVKLMDKRGAGVDVDVGNEQGLSGRVSLSPHLEMDGVDKGVARGRGSVSMEDERGAVVRSRSSSRKMADGSPIRVELGRRYEYPVEVYRREGSSVGEGKRAYYYEDEVALMRDSSDRVHLRSSPPVYRVDRRSRVVDKGVDDDPMQVVVRRRYDYPEDGVYVEEENPRLKQVYYDGRVPHSYDSRKPVYSRKSPSHRMERGFHTAERVLSKSGQPIDSREKYEYIEDIDNDDEANARIRRDYYYVDEFPISKEEYRERKFLSVSDHRELIENVKGMEEGSGRRVVELRMDSGLPSDHRDARRVYSTVDRCRFVHDSGALVDEIPSGKIVDEYYHDTEKYAQSSRDVGYHSSPRYKYKDFDDKHVLRGNPSISSGVKIRNGSLQDQGDVRPVIHDGHIRSHGEPVVRSSRNEYPRRPHLFLMDDFEAMHSHTDVKCHECDIFRSARAQQRDYLHHNLRVSGGNDSSYTAHDEFYEKMPSYVPADYDHRDLPKAAVANPMTHSAIVADGSRRIIRNNDLEEVDPTQKKKPIEHPDLRVRSDPMKQAGDYMDLGHKHEEHVRTTVVEELGIPGYKQAYRRPTDAGFQVGRRSSNEFVDGNEMHGNIAGSGTMKGDDHDIHGNYAKRKYNMVEDIVSMDARAPASRKWNKLNNSKNVHDYGEESTRRPSYDFHAKRQGGVVRNHKLEAEQMFDEINPNKSHVKDDWPRYQGKPKFFQRDFVNASQSGRTFVKGYRQPESSNSMGRPHFANRRVGNHMPHKVWERIGIENNKEVVAQGTNPSQEVEGLFNFDPVEELEDFKQMVHAEFLNFCKRLNENAAARRLYKEQGEAGSLFCIVCGRKNSKEFLNTQRLVTHAYMARKPSMRAQHLGLHKAISVLMGWNCVAAPDVVTWVPHILSNEESLAQKEDLILWPPVVIVRNISLSHNNHNEWDVISTDALGEFLRSKGFNQGKMTICLGNPGDQSVILVKFLGTFSGLREAERFHKYFSERKHGRSDLEQVISTINQNTPTVQRGTMAEKVESLLYGYLGISEDLDRMDYNTKKRCLVKSKQEIHDIADAPVKPEEAV